MMVGDAVRELGSLRGVENFGSKTIKEAWKQLSEAKWAQLL